MDTLIKNTLFEANIAISGTAQRKLYKDTKRSMKTLHVLVLFLCLSFLGSCASSPKAREQHLMPDSILYGDKTFIAMQYYSGILNRVVKVYVLNDMLSVAVVGGVVASPFFATDNWYDPQFYVNPSYEKLYIGVDPRSESFLFINRTNFQIKQSEIAKVEFDPTNKWGMGAVPHTGKILIFTKNDTEHEFILLGSQNGVFIKHLIEDTLKINNR